MTNWLLFPVVFVLLGFWHSVADAHGFGLTLEQKLSEGRTAFLDVSTPMITALDPARLDFDIVGETGESIAYTDIWVRIEQEGQLVFAGPVQPSVFGPTGFTLTFPLEGVYTVGARFQNGETELAEASFAVTVDPAFESAKKDGAALSLFSYGAAAAGGFLAAFIFIKRKKVSVADAA